VHTERLVHRLDTCTDQHRVAQSNVRDLIWKYYRALKTYGHRPIKQSKAVLHARFERIFTSKTGFVTLDRLLVRLHKSELLVVLEHPEIPLQPTDRKMTFAPR
jgi:hypothetical protein